MKKLKEVFSKKASTVTPTVENSTEKEIPVMKPETESVNETPTPIVEEEVVNPAESVEDEKLVTSTTESVESEEKEEAVVENVAFPEAMNHSTSINPPVVEEVEAIATSKSVNAFPEAMNHSIKQGSVDPVPEKAPKIKKGTPKHMPEAMNHNYK